MRLMAATKFLLALESSKDRYQTGDACRVERIRVVPSPRFGDAPLCLRELIPSAR